MYRNVTTFLLLLASCFGIACNGRRQPGPEPGTEFYSVAAETITEVLYSSSETKLYAFRWTPADAFSVFVGHRGGAPEHCAGGEGFLRWLRAVAKVPVKKELSQTVEGEKAYLQLRDTSALEPNELTLTVPAKGEPAMSYGTRQFSVGIDVSVLRNVRSGCVLLGAQK